jgi:hypothetical protein
MTKHLKYILALITIVGSYLEASTAYFPGLEVNGERSDRVRVGSAGGFSGFTIPSSTCKKLYITFMESESFIEPNTTPTFSSYTGSGVIPYLPATLKDIYIMGNATNFCDLVLGNSLRGTFAPIYDPSVYALPTPAAATTIHFLLTSAPHQSPKTWFQGALLAKCLLVIELGSADPYINTVLPLAGGDILIGAPVAPKVGFSSLLNSATGLLCIQRHPNVDVSEAYSKAVMTLAEATIFHGHVSGISLAGAYPTTYNFKSNLVDPTTQSASAGYTVDTNTSLSIFGSHAPLPKISSYLVPGGTSKITVVKTAIPLEITSLK